MTEQEYRDKAFAIEETGSLDLARDVWRELAETHSSAVNWCRLGYSAMRNEDPREALFAFRKAVEAEPRHAGGYVGQGLIAKGFGEHARAKDWFEKASKIQPSADIRTMIGQEWESMGKIERAFDEFARALSMDENCVEALCNLGRLLRQRNPEQAEPLLRRALEIDPSHRESHKELGLLLTKLGGSAAEIDELFRRAAGLNPRDAWAWVYLGSHRAACGDMQGARRCFERAVEAEPRKAFPLWSMGSLTESEGNVDEAIALYEKALELEPASPAGNYHLGHALRKKGDLQKAHFFLKQAAFLKPGYAPAEEELAEMERASRSSE